MKQHARKQARVRSVVYRHHEWTKYRWTKRAAALGVLLGIPNALWLEIHSGWSLYDPLRLQWSW